MGGILHGSERDPPYSPRMSNPHRKSPTHYLGYALLFALALIAFGEPAHAQSDDAQRKAQQAQQAQAQARLEAVRAQIAQLAQQQRDTAAQRDQINATLGNQA